MIRTTILGSGSSGGVPRIGGRWGECDPTNPKNRRRRCSLLLERTGPDGTTRVLVDTGPDMAAQLLDAGVGEVDAVVYTHPHADHVHGIDDLRQIVMNTQKILPLWADTPTTEALLDRFGYIFATPEGSFYPPIAALNLIEGPLHIEGAGGVIELIPFAVRHGEIDALGFRIPAPKGGLVYLPDVSAIPDEAWPVIRGAEIFACDALRRKPHISHAHLDQAVAWIIESNVPRGIVTNMHIDLDYETVARETPDHIEPAYDGMVIDLN